MSTLPPPPEGGNFTPPPAGTFPAVCYRVIDLGTQDSTYMGEVKRQHKVLLSWEIHDEDAVTEDGQPMTIHQRYTWSTHEKAALRKHLEAWRGKAFSDADFGPGGFDIKNVIGVSCFLGIQHNVKGDKTYANISAVSKLPKGIPAPQMVNEPVFVWLTKDLFDQNAFSKLTDNLRDIIRKAPEYGRIVNGSAGEAYTDADNGSAAHPAFDDEVPFAPDRT